MCVLTVLREVKEMKRGEMERGQRGKGSGGKMVVIRLILH